MLGELGAAGLPESRTWELSVRVGVVLESFRPSGREARCAVGVGAQPRKRHTPRARKSLNYPRAAPASSRPAATPRDAPRYFGIPCALVGTSAGHRQRYLLVPRPSGR